jgi:replicative DNA helicase
MAPQNLTYEKGLPAAVEVEKLVLGSVLLNDATFIQAGGLLRPEDFSIEKHQRIFNAMRELYERGERIDRITVANELNRKGLLQDVGGLSYLVSLDDELPVVFNIESYVRIVREKSMLRRIIYSSQEIIDRCMKGDEDPNLLLAEAEEGLLKLGTESQGSDSLKSPRQIIEEYEGGINALLDPSNRISGLSTGFVKLDECTGGLRPGQLIILAARPAMGKTAFALNIASHVTTRLGKTAAVFSLEMSKESLLSRLLCSQARVDGQRYQAGVLSKDELRRLQMAAHELSETNLFLDDSAGVNLMDMHSKLRRLKAERGLDLVVVDYLQLMSVSGRVENRVQEVSQLSRGLKLLSKELEVPFIVLSQLSRATETRVGDHRPQLSDLRESGSIEQDADIVGFLFREEYYKRDRADLHGKAEFIIAKQRNGPTRTIQLVFLHQFTRFENYTSDLPEDGGEAPPFDAGVDGPV